MDSCKTKENNRKIKLASILERSYSPLKNSLRLSNQLKDINNILTDDESNYTADTNIYSQYSKLITDYSYGERIIKPLLVDKFINEYDGLAFEVVCNTSRIDLITFNQNLSIGFEIKSRFDSLGKLNKQIEDYQKIFNHLYVVLDENHYSKIINHVNDNVGLILFCKSKTKNPLETLRKPKLNEPEIIARLNFMTKLERVKFFNESCFNSIIQQFKKSDIDKVFHQILCHRYQEKSNFLISVRDRIQKIDYQYFFKNNIDPSIIYR